MDVVTLKYHVTVWRKSYNKTVIFNHNDYTAEKSI